MEPKDKNPKQPKRGGTNDLEEKRNQEPPQIEEETGRRLSEQLERQSGEMREHTEMDTEHEQSPEKYKGVKSEQKAPDQDTQSEEPDDKGL